MRIRSRYAGLFAAVSAAMFMSSATLRAETLTWDANGTADPLGQDGSGTWDTSSTPNWVSGDLITGTNVAWTNGNSALLGSTTGSVTATSNDDVDLGAPIVVQDLTFGVGTDGAVYNVSDIGGGSLTVNGNITKTAGGGGITFLLPSNGMTLGAGDHTFALADTPGDAAEMSVNSTISGSGNVVLDNGASNPSWGTLVFNTANSYAGNTTINKGRLVVTTTGAMSSGAISIGSIGTLSIGGAGTTTTGVNISQPITITRNTYTGGDFGNYPAAIITSNGSGTSTISGPLTIDSTEGRIQANSSTLVISTSVTQGADVTAGASTLTLDGDFASHITLSADNTAFGAAGNTIKIINGVDVDASSEANLGGATSNLSLAGGFIHPTGALATSPFMTNFGTHVLAGGTVSTGLDLDAGVAFTVNGLSGGGVGERGIGTLNFAGTNSFTGTPTYDGGLDPTNLVNGRGGTINIQSGATLTHPGLRVRSATVNIAGTFNVGGSFTSIGLDSTGTSGQPDEATVNITGNGILQEASGDDFNISDNANTQGTINISGNGQFITGGITWLGKNNGSVGTINQNGGSITINRNGNFGFVIADGRGGKSPTGFYNLSNGTFTSAGEVYVGEGSNAAHGNWTQTGGTANVNNWFVVGRESAVGTVDISAGTLNHNGGNMSLGDSNGGATDTINVHGTGVINDIGGELWVGNGGAVAVMTVADSASITVNSWLAVGRSGGTGTLNMTGGTIIQKTANFLTIGSGGTGTVNISGGTLSAINTYVGETGSTTGTLNISGTASVSLGPVIFANAGTESGTINLNGGTVSGSAFTANNGGGSGTGIFFFNGGTLLPSANATNFIGAKVSSVVSTGGAKINLNAKTITVNSALKHDASGSNPDGGLTVSGTGTMIMTGANTYTGNTLVSGGDVEFANLTALGSTNSVTVAANAASGVDNGSTNAAFLAKITASTTPSTGALALAPADAAVNIDFTSSPYSGANVVGMSLGAISAGASYTGTITPASSTYRLGGGGVLTLPNANALTGANALVVTNSGAGVTIGAANNYTGNTTVNSGTLTVAAAGSITGTNNITVASGATLNLIGGASNTVVVNANGTAKFGVATAGTTRTIGTLAIGTTGLAQINSVTTPFTAPTTLAPSSISFAAATSKLDVTNNIAILTESLATLRSQIIAGNVVTSSAGLGVGSLDLGAGKVETRGTLLGDTNLDGQVNVADLGNLATNFGTTTGGTWIQGDFDYNGTVNVADLGDLATNFGLSVGGGAALSLDGGAAVASSAASVAAVPEPTSLGLIGVAAFGLMSRRRRSKK